MKILLTDKTEFDFPAPSDVELKTFDEETPIPEADLDADAIVCWGYPQSLQSMQNMPNLRWVQSLSAGTDAFFAAGIRPDVVLTNGVGLHSQTVAEHATALLLGLVRQMPELVHAQDQKRWAGEMRGPRPIYDPNRVSTLIGARALIWGFGAIGQALAPILAALGCEVRGVARTAGERAGFPVIASEDVKAALPDTDVLVMVLPSLPETERVLDAEMISLLPNRALVCNVGRGSTVDEVALVEALEAGELGGAALDVMQVEPLPATSPLWDAPRTILSPHNAGYRAFGANELIGDNLAAYLSGSQMRNRVQ